MCFSSKGRGAIVSNQVSLSSALFLTDPPVFTLAGDTSGGPPETYTWTRDGVEITGGEVTNGGSFNISLSVKEGHPARFRDSHYVSMLTVTGRYPGEYAYIVGNKATKYNVFAMFTVEGELGLLFFFKPCPAALHFTLTTIFTLCCACAQWGKVIALGLGGADIKGLSTREAGRGHATPHMPVETAKCWWLLIIEPSLSPKPPHKWAQNL